jgi:MarR family transcriptional regulator, organic hydroperoxide resistance regulator
VTEEEKFVLSIREVQVKFSRIYAARLDEVGITLPQYALLNLLAAGEMSMTEASEKLYITKPAVTHLVDKLEEIKCIKRILDAKDRRVFVLQIQPRGKKIVSHIQCGIIEILLGTLRNFKGHEKKAVLKFYERLSASIGGILNKEEERK